MKRERESDELVLNAPPTKKMKWDFLSAKNDHVFDATLLEEFLRIPSDFLNMAFRILEDGDDSDSEVERVLDEDYDW